MFWVRKNNFRFLDILLTSESLPPNCWCRGGRDLVQGGRVLVQGGKLQNTKSTQTGKSSVHLQKRFRAFRIDFSWWNTNVRNRSRSQFWIPLTIHCILEHCSWRQAQKAWKTSIFWLFSTSRTVSSVMVRCATEMRPGFVRSMYVLSIPSPLGVVQTTCGVHGTPQYANFDDFQGCQTFPFAKDYNGDWKFW